MNAFTKQELVTIAAPKFERAQFEIVGTAPLVMAAFSEKARQKMRERHEAGSTAKSKKEREARDFAALDALHGLIHFGVRQRRHANFSAFVRHEAIDEIRFRTAALEHILSHAWTLIVVAAFGTLDQHVLDFRQRVTAALARARQRFRQAGRMRIDVFVIHRQGVGEMY